MLRSVQMVACVLSLAQVQADDARYECGWSITEPLGAPTCSRDGPCSATGGADGLGDCLPGPGVDSNSGSTLKCQHPYCYSQTPDAYGSKASCECVKSTGGSCRFMGCFSYRGPSKCNANSECECQAGYCSLCGVCTAMNSMLLAASNATAMPERLEAPTKASELSLVPFAAGIGMAAIFASYAMYARMYGQLPSREPLLAAQIQVE